MLNAENKSAVFPMQAEWRTVNHFHVSHHSRVIVTAANENPFTSYRPNICFNLNFYIISAAVLRLLLCIDDACAGFEGYDLFGNPAKIVKWVAMSINRNDGAPFFQWHFYVGVYRRMYGRYWVRAFVRIALNVTDSVISHTRWCGQCIRWHG